MKNSTPDPLRDYPLPWRTQGFVSIERARQVVASPTPPATPPSGDPLACIVASNDEIVASGLPMSLADLIVKRVNVRS